MAKRHPDLDVPLELRRQTEHKLELMRRYWGTWLSILAQARGHRFCVRHLWLVDCMAGRGHHVSSVMPSGIRLGTAGSAAVEGIRAQRRFDDVVVHLRAIEIDDALAAQLDARMNRFFRGSPPDRIDVRVTARGFADVMPELINEISSSADHGHSSPAYRQLAHQHRSLWLIDPYGVRDIPHRHIEPLQRLVGAEVIINLDVGGVFRTAAASASTTPDADTLLRSVTKAQAERLDETYGGHGWHEILDSRPSEPYRALAQGYADTFPLFDYRNGYMLWASGSQYRAVIHLTNSRIAMERFHADHNRALRSGTLIAGRVLNEGQRAVAAQTLLAELAGQTLTLDEMVNRGITSHRPGQLKVIMRTAQEHGLGEWDEPTLTMKWSRHPVGSQLGLFD